jgi:dihydropteroate synthase
MLTQGTRPGNGTLCHLAGGGGAVTYRMTVPDVTAPGVLRLRRRSFGPGQRLIMARAGRTPGARGPARDEAAAMDRVHAVVAEGADIVDLGGGPAGADLRGGRAGADLRGGRAGADLRGGRAGADLRGGRAGRGAEVTGADLRGGRAGRGAEVTAAEEIRWTVPFLAAVRAAYPDLVIGVGAWRHETARELCAAGADLLQDYGGRLSEVAAEYGAGLVCGDVDRAVAGGVEPARVLVEAVTNAWTSPEATRRLEEMAAAGWPVLVSVPGPGPDAGLDTGLAAGLAGGLAATAVWAWLGARVFRVDQVTQTRRVLDMVSAIRGDLPPARAVRGLA